MASGILRIAAQWFILTVMAPALCGADGFCAEDLDDELWECGPWGSWKTVEPCDGVCGGGMARTMRIRTCSNSGVNCTSVEAEPLDCQVNCNAGVYNHNTRRCDCPLGTTGPCCVRDLVKEVQRDSIMRLNTEMLRTHSEDIKKTCTGRKARSPIVENPTEYLICSGQSSNVLRCPGVQVYNSYWSFCKPPAAWTLCEIENVPYARGYVNPRNGGQVCDPERNENDWTTVFACPSPNGQFPLRDNDKFYFNCRHNSVTLEPCPTLTRFNRNTGTCEAREATKDCRIEGHRYKPGQVNPLDDKMICDPSKSATEWSKVFDCPQPNGAFAYPEDNTMFYHCEEGKPPQLIPCQLHSIFLERLQRCWYPEERHGCLIHGMFYEAGAEHPMEDYLHCDPSRSVTSWTPYFECGKGEQYFVNAQDPKSYFICRDRYLQQYTCPGVSMFFEQIQGCGPIPQESYCIISNMLYAKGYMNPRNRSQICSPYHNTTAWSLVPGEPMQLTVPLPIAGEPGVSCLQQYGQQRVKGDRSVFVQCADWSPFLRHCRNGSVYIVHLKRCSYTAMVLTRAPILSPIRRVLHTRHHQEERQHQLPPFHPRGGH